MGDGARKRVPLSADYAASLGVATYCFALCEWNLVWCGERIKGGFLNKVVGDEMTAGQIGRAFGNLVRNMPPSTLRAELEVLAAEFLRLVEVRNGIAHGKPCAGPSGESRLSSSKVLETSDVDAAADEFATCSAGFNRLLHGPLKS